MGIGINYNKEKEIFEMGNFTEALVSKEKSALIPEEYDYWGEFIGNWDISVCYKTNCLTILNL